MATHPGRACTKLNNFRNLFSQDSERQQVLEFEAHSKDILDRSPPPVFESIETGFQIEGSKVKLLHPVSGSF